MNTSQEINELAKALATAQAEIQNPVKNQTNPHFKSDYVDLAGGLDAIRPALSKHGLSIVQTTALDGELMMLTTRLLHSSGQWIESTYPVIRFPAQQQAIGSALSYARRYSVFAMAGVAAASDDDDGNEGSKDKTPAPMKPKPVQRRDEPPPSHDDFPGDAPSNDEPASNEAIEYAFECKGIIQDWKSNAAALKQWWEDEAKHREAAGIHKGSDLYNQIFETFKTKGLSLTGQPKRAA